MIPLLCTLAVAQVPVALDAAPLPAEPAAPVALEQLWAQQNAWAVHDEAVEHRRAGDLEGARDRLEHLVGRGDLVGEASYQLGILDELGEDYESALLRYEAVLSRAPASTVATDAAFRRALVLEDLGRHEEALAQVESLRSAGGWDALDQASLDLEAAVARLRTGERRAEKELRQALSLVPEGELSWMQARARAALVEHLVAQAADIAITGNRRAARALRKRTALMVEAEAEVVSIARLDEPEYAFAGIEALGRSYEDLYRAMMDAPPPRRLSAEGDAIYTAEVAERSRILRAKAAEIYDQGVQLAVRIGWRGSARGRLQALRDALVTGTAAAPPSPATAPPGSGP